MKRLILAAALLMTGCLHHVESTSEVAADDGQPARGVCEPPDWSTCQVSSLGYPVCAEADGTSWQLLHTGEAIHYAPETATGAQEWKLCDVAPDGGIIWSVGMDGGK